ncbi:MAG TPA: GNAT family N-acetyltransferase [Acidimicrobiia bacterium]|nr:GNAT family N-acetyltransferase [Acidimicrobiia bacterium]
MTVTARAAGPEDVPVLTELYVALAAEMDAIKPIWSVADGLPVPVDEAFTGLLDDLDARMYIGEIDGVPVGFLMARDEDLLPHADGRRVAAVRLIFTLSGARGVGVGEAMIDLFLDEATSRGIVEFDAHVSPGHRESKNFFESNGFKARSIVMHRSDR